MGRNKVDEKVIPVTVFQKPSRIEHLGGIKKVKEDITNFLNKKK